MRLKRRYPARRTLPQTLMLKRALQTARSFLLMADTYLGREKRRREGVIAALHMTQLDLERAILAEREGSR